MYSRSKNSIIFHLHDMQIIEGCVSSNATCSGEYLLSESILSRNHLRKALVSRFSCSSEASNWSKPLLPKYPWCPEDSHRICIVEVLPTRTVFLKLFKIDHTGSKTNFLARNYQEFDAWKMWIVRKMRFWNCEFCEKWNFKNVNFVKNETLKKCEFCEKWNWMKL